MKRKYLNRIEVWVNNADLDSVGGENVSPIKLSDSWCNINTIRRDKLVAFGLDIPTQAISIKTRFRNDLDYFQDGLFFKYKGKDWIVNSIHNVDLEDENIDIVATAIP